MMKVAKRVLSVMALAGPLALGGAGPASAASGANVIQCSDVFSQLGGVILFGPNGDFKANCWEHLLDRTRGPAVDVTTVFNCSEQFPGFDPASLVGIQVITAGGNILTNCHVHVGGGTP